MDDAEMMSLRERDDEQWYGLLIDRYTGYVTAIIGGIMKGAVPATDIEEIAADVFFRVWRNRAEIRSASVKPYIAKVARNAAIDRLRLKGAQLVPYEDDVLQVSFSERPDDLTIIREQRDIVEEAVQAFQPPDREIFIRHYYFGEAVKAIADSLGLNTQTTKTKLRRARLKLRDILQERGYGCE